MTERPTSEQAEKWLSEHVELMGELRNATTRDAGFREWRQNTLTVLQRLWPGKPTRAQRFRRVAFAPPTGASDEALARESFEKGFAEARRLLQFWLAEIKLNGLNDHGGPIEPDDDAFTMPKTEGVAESGDSEPSDLGIEKAEFSAEPSGEDAGLGTFEEVAPVADAGSMTSAVPMLPTTPTRIEAPRAETPSVPTTPTRIEAPRPMIPSVPMMPTRVDGTTGTGARPAGKDATAKRMAEIVKFPSPPPHAPEYLANPPDPSGKVPPAQPKAAERPAAERPAKSAQRPRKARLKDMLGLGDDSVGASAPPPSAAPTPSPSPKPEPSVVAQAPVPTPGVAPKPPAKIERAPAKPAAIAPARAGSGARPAGSGGKSRGSGGRTPSPGTQWATRPAATTSAAASPRAQAAVPSPSASAAPTAQSPTPTLASSPLQETETRPTVERPGELVSAHESLIEAMTGVFVTKPDLGSPIEPPIRPEVTLAAPPKPAAGSSSAPGETVIAFPLGVPSVPTLIRSTPGVPEIVALAGELERLGVPASEMGRVRDALMNLALRLGTGKVDWQLLQVGVSLVMRHPRLAARALPLLLPYFERAA